MGIFRVFLDGGLELTIETTYWWLINRCEVALKGSPYYYSDDEILKGRFVTFEYERVEKSKTLHYKIFTKLLKNFFKIEILFQKSKVIICAQCSNPSFTKANPSTLNFPQKERIFPQH